MPVRGTYSAGDEMTAAGASSRSDPASAAPWRGEKCERQRTNRIDARSQWAARRPLSKKCEFVDVTPGGKMFDQNISFWDNFLI